MTPLFIVRWLGILGLIFLVSNPAVRALTTSPILRTHGGNADINRGQIVSLRMSDSNEGEAVKGSYEQQYAAYAKMRQQQQQKPLLTNNIVDNPRQAQSQDDCIGQTYTEKPRSHTQDRVGAYTNEYASLIEDNHQQLENDSGPVFDPRKKVDHKSPAVMKSIRDHGAYLRRQQSAETNARRDSAAQKKAQNDIEKAFLEFISAGGSHQSKTVPPRRSVQKTVHHPQDVYSGISLDFDAHGNPKDQNMDEKQGIDNTRVTVNGEPSKFPKFEFGSGQDENCDGNKGMTTNNAPSITLSVNTGDTTTKTTASGASLSSYSVSNIDAAGGDKEWTVTTATTENAPVHTPAADIENDTDFVHDTDEMDSTVDSSKPKEDDCNYSTIEVQIETTLPNEISVDQAKRGWLEFCWVKGGGIVVPATKPSDDSTDINATTKTTTVQGKDLHASEKSKTTDVFDDDTIDMDVPLVRELIMPLGMKQELVTSKSTTTPGPNSNQFKEPIRRETISYKTTHRGLFCQDMVPNSHEGKVEFIGASYTSTRMIWTVTFQIKKDDDEEEFEYQTVPGNIDTIPEDKKNGFGFVFTTKTMMEEYSKQLLESNPGLKSMMSKENLWGSWSQFQLKTATQNLLAYLDNAIDSMPTMEHVETLPLGVSPREAMEAWYDYYWCKGGGVLPVITSSSNSDIRWVVPSALEEEILLLEYDRPTSESLKLAIDGEVETETEIAQAVYRVNNPNLLTYPVHYNRSTVKFIRETETSPTQLIWKVKVQPYRKFFSGGVQFWTKNGISLASRNLKHYIEGQQLKKRKKELQEELEMLDAEIEEAVGEYSNKDGKECDEENQPGDSLETVEVNDSEEEHIEELDLVGSTEVVNGEEEDLVFQQLTLSNDDIKDIVDQIAEGDILHQELEGIEDEAVAAHEEEELEFEQLTMSNDDINDVVDQIKEGDTNDYELEGIEDEMLVAHEDLQQLLAENSNNIIVDDDITDDKTLQHERLSAPIDERGRDGDSPEIQVETMIGTESPSLTLSSSSTSSDEHQSMEGESLLTKDGATDSDDDGGGNGDKKELPPIISDRTPLMPPGVTRVIETAASIASDENKGEDQRPAGTNHQRHQLEVDATPLVSSSVTQGVDTATRKVCSKARGEKEQLQDGRQKEVIRPESEVACSAVAQDSIKDKDETSDSVSFQEQRAQPPRIQQYVEVGPDATIYHGASKSAARGVNGRKRPTITPMNEEGGSMFRPRPKQSTVRHPYMNSKRNNVPSDATRTIDVPSEDVIEEGEKGELRP